MAIDVGFADAPGDELRVLRSKIQNENSIVPEFHTFEEPMAYS